MLSISEYPKHIADRPKQLHSGLRRQDRAWLLHYETLFLGPGKEDVGKVLDELPQAEVLDLLHRLKAMQLLR